METQKNYLLAAGFLELKTALLKEGHSEETANYYLSCSQMAANSLKKGFVGSAVDFYNLGARAIGKPQVKGIKESGSNKYHFTTEGGKGFVYNPEKKESPFEPLETMAPNPKDGNTNPGDQEKNDPSENDLNRTPDGGGSTAISMSGDHGNDADPAPQKNENREASRQPQQQNNVNDVPRTAGGEPMLSFPSMENK